MAEDIDVLKLHLKNSLEEFLDSLKKKSEFIKSQYQKPLNEAMMKRLQIEEDHVNKSILFVELSEKVINAQDARLFVKQRILDIFYQEQKEYMDKYYNLACAVMGNQVKADVDILIAIDNGKIKSNKK